MTILTSANGSLPLTLRKGETLVIRNYSGTETVTGSTAAREDVSSTAGAGAVAYGPQSSAATLTISSSGSMDYSVVAGDMSPAVNALVSVPTGQIVTPGGDVVGDGGADGLSANTEDTSSVSIARQIKASAGRVTSILCTTGSAITLTLYDNAAASATGRQIYSGALSAGAVVQPADAWFAQGCYASFTGTAAFVINTSESAE